MSLSSVTVVLNAMRLSLPDGALSGARYHAESGMNSLYLLVFVALAMGLAGLAAFSLGL